MKINIVGVRKYSFIDRKTDQLIEGSSLYYVAEKPFDENLVGKISGKLNIGAKASNQLSTNELISANYCEADFDNTGRLISLKPVSSSI